MTRGGRFLNCCLVGLSPASTDPLYCARLSERLTGGTMVHPPFYCVHVAEKYCCTNLFDLTFRFANHFVTTASSLVEPGSAQAIAQCKAEVETGMSHQQFSLLQSGPSPRHIDPTPSPRRDGLLGASIFSKHQNGLAFPELYFHCLRNKQTGWFLAACVFMWVCVCAICETCLISLQPKSPKPWECRHSVSERPLPLARLWFSIWGIYQLSEVSFIMFLEV